MYIRMIFFNILDAFSINCVVKWKSSYIILELFQTICIYIFVCYLLYHQRWFLEQVL